MSSGETIKGQRETGWGGSQVAPGGSCQKPAAAGPEAQSRGSRILQIKGTIDITKEEESPLGLCDPSVQGSER